MNTAFSRRTVLAMALSTSVLGCRQIPIDQTTETAAPNTPDILRRDIAPALYEVVYSAMQDAVFVASAGGLTPDANDSPPSRILRLAPDTLATQAEIALPMRGFGLVLDDASNRLYVNHGVDAALSVIDATNGTILHTLRLAQKLDNIDTSDPFAQKYPHYFRHMVLDSTRQRIYMPGMWLKDSALYVINIGDGKTAPRIEKIIEGLGVMASGISLLPGTDRLVTSNLDGQLFVINPQTLTIEQTIAMDAEQALYLARNEQAHQLFAVDQGLEGMTDMRKKDQPDYQPKSPGNRVVVLDTRTFSTLAHLPTGDGPVAMLADNPRQRLYVTNRRSGNLAVVDTSTLKILQSVPLPMFPNSLALDSKRNVLYVSVKNEESETPTPPTKPESLVRIAWGQPS